MKGLRFIKRRIRSVRNTQRITRAMKMVSAAKLNRVEGALKTFRLYSDGFLSAVEDVISSLGNVNHPFLDERKEEKILIVAITSDRGLCGSYNERIMNMVEEQWRKLEEKGIKVEFFAVGRRGSDYLKKRGAVIRDTLVGAIDRDLDGFQKKLIDVVSGTFLSGQADAIYTAYSEFVSALTQVPTWKRILPAPFKPGSVYRVEPIVEPDRQVVVERIMVEYLRVATRRVLLEAITSEHAARMTAMDNATKNADEMIENLTLLYNKARQASITSELLDITNGKEAIEFG